MIASLTMYDRPETAAANDHLWTTVRANLNEGPETLTRDGDVWDHWHSPDLILAQTCGYPFRAKLHGKVTLVGTPIYDLSDCPDGHYYSVIVARADDPRSTAQEFSEARFAYNEALSQSGWAAPQNHAALNGFAFTNPVQSGAHRNSARMVADGRADCASLDALSWKLMQRHDDFAASLKVVEHTAPTPVLPYITAKTRDPAPLFNAMTQAIATLSPADRNALAIKGITNIPMAQYLAIPNPPPPSVYAAAQL
ncbi:ABC transporter, phosphonate, periplasmic substrate-binding protein [Roseovarius albus]|uniref:ABC transporter, phosphonate, periplasmic substrate-binding protein n=1 Tax=Roseovarius albus TaxID=1247867 RepID=A0A1X6Y5F3_9RHOB|nr:PhnD/SsuA/transferrin family substrate-binding protein [Roseovarius albus]SLN10798.1 ABC transporter, phosphonate, periplasmic substrate-binding protein [Roseovarius albus]